jgi:AraC-like DNA-binding protein
LFFAKNRDLKLMMGNPAFVARCGKKTEAEIVGIDDYDLFPSKLAAQFRKDDLQVLETGTLITGIVELFPNTQGNPDWSVTEKIPLFSKNGEVCGLCGTVRSYEGVRESLACYLEVQPAADYLKKNFREKLDIGMLAKLVGMSERQLERKFQETFRTSPRAYLSRTRILIAGELLKRTSKTVTEIAFEVGFYDHSDLSRHFKKEMGESPTEFRMNSGR